MFHVFNYVTEKQEVYLGPKMAMDWVTLKANLKPIQFTTLPQANPQIKIIENVENRSISLLWVKHVTVCSKVRCFDHIELIAGIPIL